MAPRESSLAPSPNWTNVSFEEARATLRRWREDHTRRSEETVEIWEHILSRWSTSLNDELWQVLEQVAIAALDCARAELAAECVDTLAKQFPKSGRVTKLQALRLEALGRYSEAATLYESLLAADETSMALRKRKIAMLVARGQRAEAIEELTEHLQTFVNDGEAWAELGELYIADGDLARAIFCLEEQLLANPHNGALYCQIAELRYTQGGVDNIEQARAYYERAAKLNLGARALYGVILCSHALLPKSAGAKKAELVELVKAATEKLGQLYANSPGAAVYSKVHRALALNAS